MLLLSFANVLTTRLAAWISRQFMCHPCSSGLQGPPVWTLLEVAPHPIREASDSIEMFCWGIIRFFPFHCCRWFNHHASSCFPESGDKGHRTVGCLVLEQVKDLSVGSCKTVVQEGLLVPQRSFCL